MYFPKELVFCAMFDEDFMLYFNEFFGLLALFQNTYGIVFF